MFSFHQRRPKTTGTGIGLNPGDDHYRAFVGPPEDYDRVAAMAFNLLTSIGLRQHHRVLDIGCGSLRIGRLLIPYLDKGNYLGIEPNRWLVTDGILNEVGRDQIRIKAPRFFYRASLEGCGENLEIGLCVGAVDFQPLCPAAGERLALPVVGTSAERGRVGGDLLLWHRGLRRRRLDLSRLRGLPARDACRACGRVGIAFELLNWRHPRQTWALFSKPHYDRSLVSGGVISWNRVVEQSTGW